MHQRLRPCRHRLSYRMFFLLLDLDEIEGLSKRLRLFSHNSFNLFSFADRDHSDGSGRPLKGDIERQLKNAGIETDGGPVRLMCMPRVLGYVFNPLSVYFCHRRDGQLAAMIYEVNNTFGERHSYLIPAADPSGDGPVEQHCTKRLYVSPFMDMKMRYDFRIRPPADKVSLHITGSDDDGALLFAAFSGTRRPLGDGALASAFVSYPLLTLKVIAGIHWEALRIWMKGVRVRERPAPPRERVTHVMNSQSHRKADPDAVGY